MKSPIASAGAEAPSPVQLCIAAIGGAGAKIAKSVLAAPSSHVRHLVADTDRQALSRVDARTAIQIGLKSGAGTGTAADSGSGREAAHESLGAVMAHLDGATKALIVAGLGGGTGSGIAPAICRAARERGLFTVAFVTTPFEFEGFQRRLIAERGVLELEGCADLVIVMENQRLIETVEHDTPLAEALRMVDRAFGATVRIMGAFGAGEPLLDLNFAELGRILAGGGRASITCGEGSGDDRVAAALQSLRECRAFGTERLDGQRRLIVDVSGGPDLSLRDVDSVAHGIREMAHPEAEVHFGASLDDACANRLVISVLGIGLGTEAQEHGSIGANVRAAGGERDENVASDAESGQENPENRTAGEIDGAFHQDAVIAPESEAIEADTSQPVPDANDSAGATDADASPLPPIPGKPLVIAVADMVSGSGKSTFARHLSRQAERDGAGPSVVVEVHSQNEPGSDSSERCGKIGNVAFVRSSFERLAAHIEALRDGEFGHIFIDASPGTNDELERVVAVADSAIVPVRPNKEHVKSVGAVVAALERHGRKFVMVINGARDGDLANARVAMALAQHGVVCPVIVPLSEAFADPEASDQAILETDPEGQDAGHMVRLWAYLAKRFAAKGRSEAKPRAEAASGAERRRFPRWPLHWPVKVTAAGETFDTILENISGGGVMIENSRGLSAGEWVRIEIETLGMSFEAEVAHTNDTQAGLRFILEGARQWRLAERLAFIVEREKSEANLALDSDARTRRAAQAGS
jgi:cell division protein FtsZ